jgi:hypothetical protein
MLACRVCIGGYSLDPMNLKLLPLFTYLITLAPLRKHSHVRTFQVNNTFTVIQNICVLFHQ